MQPIDNPEKRLLETPVPSLNDSLHRDTLKQSLLAEMQKERVMTETTLATNGDAGTAKLTKPRRRVLRTLWLAVPAVAAAIAVVVYSQMHSPMPNAPHTVALKGEAARLRNVPMHGNTYHGRNFPDPNANKSDPLLTVDLEPHIAPAVRPPLEVLIIGGVTDPGPRVFTNPSTSLGGAKKSDSLGGALGGGLGGGGALGGALGGFGGGAPTAGGPVAGKGSAVVGGAVEGFGGDTYAPLADNPFHKPAQSPLSTFSIDVDTASYTNVRRFLLQEKQLPPKDAVRIEEMINYFTYDDPQPEAGKPVAIKTEVGPCPWNAANRLVRIGLRAKSVSAEKSPPRNLVFLVDTSGSMSSEDRLPLLKQGLQMLVGTLRPEDRVAIVAYAGSAGLVLPSTAGNNKNDILAALGRLQSGGSTNGGQGIELAYSIAQEHFIKDGVNRVILGTDGDFNVGVTSQGDLVKLIEDKRKTGVFLSILGFGHGNLKDATMEKLAHHGNGHYAYIDTAEEAHRIFVEQGASLQVVAGDVKVQVEFNPARVAAYRLVGYENRLMKHEDFNDDTKDAGDMGSGHTVTALYEIVPTGEAKAPGVDPLRYQDQPAPVPPPVLKDAAKSNELMMVKVRYKDPGADVSKLVTQPVVDGRKQLPETSVDFRFAAAVAEFALILRDSPHKGTANLANVIAQSRGAIGPDFHGQRAAFVQMAEATRALVR